MSRVFLGLFAGSCVERCAPDYELALTRSFEEQMRRSAVEATARCFVAPFHVEAEKRAWAEYSPKPGETYWETSCVQGVKEQLRESTREAWPWLEARAAEDCPGVIVGISNGCIPAAEAALAFDVPVLVLLSGMPAEEQLEELCRHFHGETIMAVGRRDRCFGGRRA